ncbi:MAG: NAD(P)/FAD-dependent oxidoreductase [Candidatus Cyclobacteriaceae bacterium M2_1C_046]
MRKSVIICGGGAAGFFAAINIAEKHPDYRITILEKSNKILSKVKISGGGRCNVTNERNKPSELVKFYPRGEKKLYPLFKRFSTDDMKRWLSDRGVKTKTEADLRVFPVTNSSQTVIDCFLRLINKYNIQLVLNEGLDSFEQKQDKWTVITTKNKKIIADVLLIATGSAPSIWKKLQEMSVKIEPPVPSLFTFNIKDPRIQELSGVAFDKVEVKITGTKLKEEGPLLITHWGLSGPAVLKLSAWGARDLAELNYRFDILINFIPEKNFDQGRQIISRYISQHPKRKVVNNPIIDVPKRYWESICRYIEINDEALFSDLGKKSINKLTEELTQGKFSVTAKSTFKEEFVTCGGVSLSEVDLETLQSNKFPNLYFAGEVLDIDAITGGFNFQSCWSTAWIISESV